MLIHICDRDINVDGRIVRMARLDGEKYRFLADPAQLVEGLRHSSARADVFTFIERINHVFPKYTYPMEWDNFAALRITTFENWWTKQLDNKTRNMIRKAERRGVEAREVPFDDDLVRGICAVYNECPIRQGNRFLHYGMTCDEVRKHAGTFLESSVFIGAFLGGEMVGFIKLTWDECCSQAGIMHIISMIKHRDKAATNALVAQAVKSSAERGIPYLVYSNFTYGKKQHDTLSDFKRNNGFQKVDVPRYYAPLNPLGRIALAFGLHHRLADHLPEGIAAALRELRRSWYSHRLHVGQAR